MTLKVAFTSLGRCGLGFWALVQIRGMFTLTKQPQDVDMAGQAGAGGANCTEDMIRVGVKALRVWIPTDDDRYCGYDHFAVRDAFERMHKLLVKKSEDTTSYPP